MSYRQAGISITATSKEVCDAVEKYAPEYDGNTSGHPVLVSHIYTPEAFLDALAKWIITDDQVSIYIILFDLFSDALGSSLLMQLKVYAFVKFLNATPWALQPRDSTSYKAS